MKYKILAIFPLSFLTLAASIAQSQTTVSVTTLLTEVDQALRSVATSNAIKALPKFTRARLTLNTVIEEESGGVLVLKIFNLGNQDTEQFVQTITLELTPPPRSTEPDLDTDPIASVTDSVDLLGDALSNAIIATARAVMTTPFDPSHISNEPNEQPPPKLTKLTASVRFAVTGTDSTGIDFAVVEIGRNTMQQNVQEIFVEFGNDDSP